MKHFLLDRVKQVPVRFMSKTLEELLEKLNANGIGDFLRDHCNVEQEIARLRTQIDQVPSEEDDDKAFVSFVLNELRNAGNILVKDARKRELELEIRMLDKPDSIDLGSEEWQHAARHIEEEQYRCELERRKGKAFLRFCDLVNAVMK